MRIVVLGLLALLGLGVGAAQAAAVVEPLAEKDGLKVSIGENNIELRRSDPHISVVLQNTSSKPMNVFQEWNSWGAYNLTLEVTSIDGKVLDNPLVVGKGGMIWKANIPSAETIAPGDVLVREVRLQVSKHLLDPSVPETADDLNPRGPFYWGFPVPKVDERRRVTMRAMFANDDPHSDTGMERRVVWTGRIASPFKDYTVCWGAS